jgi:hypothetical protein
MFIAGTPEFDSSTVKNAIFDSQTLYRRRFQRGAK